MYKRVSRLNTFIGGLCVTLCFNNVVLAQAAAPELVPALAPVASPVSAPRLAIASRIAAKMLPDGLYSQMMSGSLKQMMPMIMDSLYDMPLRDLVGMSGADVSKIKAMGPATTRQIMAITDPAFDKRMQLLMGTMMPEMGKVMTSMEPDFRAGLAEALAGRFEERQLSELDAFFATPTGNQFISQSMTIMADPSVMKRMSGMMPMIMKAMPGIMEKVKAATASLPEPRKYAQLSKAEKQKLAQILGLDPAKVK